MNRNEQATHTTARPLTTKTLSDNKMPADGAAAVGC